MKKKDNILILVDYDNVFITLEKYYRDFKNRNIMYDVIPQIQQLYKKENIIGTKLFADLQKVNISGYGYDVLNHNAVELRHVANGKNASDISLMLECIKHVHLYPHIDKYVIVSADSDMISIGQELKLQGKLLDVIHTQVNSSAEHMEKMKDWQINAITLESILNLNVANQQIDVNELFGKLSSNKQDFQVLMQEISDIITHLYRRFSKTDAKGNIVALGSTSLASLSYYARENKLLPEIVLTKNGDNCIFVDMLLSYGVIKMIEYQIGYKKYATYILSEGFLSQYQLEINHLITANDFPTTWI